MLFCGITGYQRIKNPIWEACIMMSEYSKTLLAQCRADARFNDKMMARLNRIDEILQGDYTPEVKFVRLVSECGYGRMRAAELTGVSYARFKNR